MGKQFELKFEDEMTEPEKIRKDLFRGILDKYGLNSKDLNFNYNLFNDVHDSENIPNQLVKIYNNWAEENNFSERVQLEEFQDKFGHTKYKVSESKKEAA
jgi:dissimilatory sulfite reductase (desulfoviridin) alpha/beta subunit